MAVTNFRLEEMFEEADLKFLRIDDDRWMLPFATCYVRASLQEDGEVLHLRGSHVAELGELSQREHHRALLHFMRLNDRIKLGRFCGSQEVAFEICLPIEDGDLTVQQLERCVYSAAQMTRDERYPPARDLDESESESDDPTDADEEPTKELRLEEQFLPGADRFSTGSGSVEEN